MDDFCYHYRPAPYNMRDKTDEELREEEFREEIIKLEKNEENMGKPLDEKIESEAREFFKAMPESARTYIDHHIRNCLFPIPFIIHKLEKQEPIIQLHVNYMKQALDHLTEDLKIITGRENE